MKSFYICAARVYVSVCDCVYLCVVTPHVGGLTCDPSQGCGLMPDL